MRGKRGLLFTVAALGAILAVAGAGIVIWAWIYPGNLVERLGANVTPDDLMGGLRTLLLGTIAGGLVTAGGIAALVLSFRALDRDLRRMAEEAEAERELSRR